MSDGVSSLGMHLAEPGETGVVHVTIPSRTFEASESPTNRETPPYPSVITSWAPQSRQLERETGILLSTAIEAA